ncbi:hypothetical protein YYC_01336 [Plasmodium yoelii 17X]|uniref:Ubiquitin carboxyl-terminal hydrolase MINDY n=4 Tax=Plasmodium yoelii TaxID=5861 RepID=A0AAE9WYD2_PLAYO|nr:ubiquitin carboxyl-terminal hydrolase MINDY, putative [Plasmodium yoelii]EAA22835.1 hypothetical protein [Plasmodium yoelii yoelii]ETB61439.1 hypothetical protein YYC_01336 [Plasmodium yoelii 17X]WBY60770.1 ubiquitin carboxyl-terminal hydrolase MINDY [Plasmodium yoelii yoelii]CDU20546.1 conserved protein, unknown function [Plasmodium yoelii]VTZ81507.1 ubiquitin carboxyl-terminal hydrolase MINDY, putative [Plasmodium yoelii]|eukprot:XP_731270.1 ubiquitin carboxyl-terminal hydrolase MINDY, putative [Plasmodium yoelii]
MSSWLKHNYDGNSDEEENIIVRFADYETFKSYVLNKYDKTHKLHNYQTDNIYFYTVKWITFINRKVPILLQNKNGACPLLCIANILLLRNQLHIDKKIKKISQKILEDKIISILLESNKKNVTNNSASCNYRKNIIECIDILPQLKYGLDVNCKFTDIQSFEYTKGLCIFDMLNIPLYHGWVISADDKIFYPYLKDYSYNVIINKVIKYNEYYEKKRKSVSKEESSNENLLIISQALNLDFESDDGGNCSVPKKIEEKDNIHINDMVISKVNSNTNKKLEFKTCEHINTMPIENSNSSFSIKSSSNTNAKIIKSQSSSIPIFPDDLDKNSEDNYKTNMPQNPVLNLGNYNVGHDPWEDKSKTDFSRRFYNSNRNSYSNEIGIVNNNYNMINNKSNVNQNNINNNNDNSSGKKNPIIPIFLKKDKKNNKGDTIEINNPEWINKAGDVLKKKKESLTLLFSSPLHKKTKKKDKEGINDYENVENINKESKNGDIKQPLEIAYVNNEEKKINTPKFPDDIISANDNFKTNSFSFKSDILDTSVNNNINANYEVFEKGDKIKNSNNKVHSENIIDNDNKYKEHIIINNYNTNINLTPREFHEALIILEFLEVYKTQLTLVGLKLLQENLNANQLVAFFRNNHFNTLFKYNNKLFLLVGDISFLHLRCTWELFDSVNNDTTYCDNNFKCITSENMSNLFNQHISILNSFENMSNLKADMQSINAYSSYLHSKKKKKKCTFM